MEAGNKGDNAGGMASDSGGAAYHIQVTLVVASSGSTTASVLLTAAAVTTEDFIRGPLVKYGMRGCRPSGTSGHGKKLSLMQPEENLLDEEEKRRRQAVVRSTMFLGQATGYAISYAVNE